MTYLLLCTGFLVVAASAAAILSRAAQTRQRSSGGDRHRLAGLALGGGALLLLTAVFDSLMIAAGLFTYSEDRIAGPRVGLAPIEDFAYPLAVLILLPALWTFLRSRRDR